MKTYRWIVITVLVLSLGFPAMTASAAASHLDRAASLALTAATPNPISVSNETTFDLIPTVANVDPGVAGIEIYLRYNPALVAPATTPGVGAAEVRPDFFGASNVSINEALPAAQCPGGGTSPCLHLVLAGPAQVNQTGIAVRFHFRGIAEGSACFVISQSNMVDANGFQVEHAPASQQCVSIQVRANASGVILRQGVPGNPNPGGGNLACSSVITSGAGTFGPTYTDRNGRFTLTNLLSGTYTFRATYPGYLASEKVGVTVIGSSQAIDLGTTTLRGGDVNGDNAINILDIGAVISKFGRTGVAVKSVSANCSGADEPADVNDDGLINISDLAIAAGNWGLVGPTNWP